MLDKKKIFQLFHRLNELLSERGETGEIGIVGGTVMCIVYDVRNSTKDVDAIFKPTKLLRELAKKIAEEEGIESDWLNDAVKGLLVEGFKRVDVLNLSHLRVWAPEPRYMLAMKCLAARWDSHDKEDVIFLIQLLKLKAPKEVFEIIESYYPKNQILPKTKFFLEEILSKSELRKKRESLVR